jgi:hypothetical protein
VYALDRRLVGPQSLSGRSCWESNPGSPTRSTGVLNLTYYEIRVTLSRVRCSEVTMVRPLTICEITFIPLTMEAVRTSETSVYFTETTRRYIPEGC